MDNVADESAAIPIWSGRSAGTRRFSFSAAQLLAASVVWTLLSGGTVWMALDGGSEPPTLAPTDVTQASEAGESGSILPVTQVASSEYERAIASLEFVLEQGRGRLNPQTVGRVVRMGSRTSHRKSAASWARSSPDFEHFMDPFVLKLRNGSEDGTNRISSATVVLDGAQLFGPSDFSQQVAELSALVTVTETSELSVRLTSKPRSHVTIWIEGKLKPGRGLVFALTLCLAATVGCQQGPDPLQKAFDAIGGQDLG